MITKTKIASLILIALVLAGICFVIISYLSTVGKNNWPPAIISTTLVFCAYTLMAKDILSKK
jgi:hypothetical protein